MKDIPSVEGKFTITTHHGVSSQLALTFCITHKGLELFAKVLNSHKRTERI